MENFPKRSHCTLIFIHQGPQILMGLKKRGLGAGLWNGFGGKVDVAKETITASAMREMQEECSIAPIDLRFVGLIRFNMLKDEKTIIVHVFKTNSYTGEVTESEEMKPQWFATNELPYKQMWPDDYLWYPDMLEDKLFLGEYSFQAHDDMVDSNHRVVELEELMQAHEKHCKVPLK